MIKHNELYTFVVHTNSYAGNFEREMAAFMTGQVGECEVGSEMAELFVEEVDSAMQDEFTEIIGSVADDNGCYRPCAIYETPNRGNNGSGMHGDVIDEASKAKFSWPAYESVAIYFDKIPTKPMIDLMKARAVEYADNYSDKRYGMKVKGFQLLKNVTKTEIIDTNEELEI